MDKIDLPKKWCTTSVVVVVFWAVEGEQELGWVRETFVEVFELGKSSQFY